MIAIITILTSMGLGIYASVQKKSRDSRRKSDLNQIVKGVELYFTDFGLYPASSADGKIIYCGAANDQPCSWGDAFEDDNQIYIKRLPEEPQSSTKTYYYQASDDKKSFRVMARLENTDDLQASDISGTDGYCTSDSSLQCNFGLTSSNVDLVVGW